MSNRSNRFPAIPRELYTGAQQRAAAALPAGPRGEVRGPFIPLLYSPALLDHAQQLGEYLRYHSAIPQPLREFAILVAARHWRQTYEWHAHAPLAAKAGIPAAVIAELASGLDPGQLSAEQAIIYRFCREVHAGGQVTDESFDAAKCLLGETGVVDLIGLCGYYAMLAMVLNVAQTAVPGDPPNPFGREEP